MKTDNQIELTKAHRGGTKSTTFAGRPEGRKVRANLDLDKKDKEPNNYQVVIPNDTTSMNPSFYLGLFFESIELLGIERFQQKYAFNLSTMEPRLKEVVEDNLKECLRKAINEYNDVTGLD